MSELDGISSLDAGFFRIPVAFIDVMARIDGAELKIILYVMRHTWGFQEYDTYKKITTDEFVHGRRLKNRERMDSGTGLSDRGVKDGIAKAIEHGFLECEIDDSDGGRVQKSYRIKIKQDTQTEPKPVQKKVVNNRLAELKEMPYLEYLQTPEWKKKRAKALRFAQFKCQLCNDSGMLNVHHRTYERRGHELLGDLIVLCKDCHDTFHQTRELA